MVGRYLYLGVLLGVAVHAFSQGVSVAERIRQLELVPPTQLVAIDSLGLPLLQAAGASKQPDVQARVHRVLGKAYYASGNLELALHHFQEELGYWTDLDSAQRMAMAENGVGVVLQRMGRNRQSARHFFLGAEIMERLGDSLALAKVNNNLGIVYREVGLHELAENRLQRAIRYYQQQGDSALLGQSINNQGLNFMAQGKHQLALPLLLRAERLKSAAHDPQLSTSLHNIGLTYQALGQFEQARNYLEKGFEERKKRADHMGLVSSLYALAELSLKQGNLQSAQDYLSAADTVFAGKQNWSMAERYNRLLSEWHKQAGDFSKAHEFLVLAEAYEDSIQDNQSKDELIDLQREQSELSEERKLQSARAESRLQAAKLKQGYWILGLVIALSLVLLIFALVLVNQLKRIRELNVKYLHEKDTALANARLKTQILNNMSHEIRTPLNGIIGLAELIKEEENEIERKMYVDLQLKSAHRLLETINGILNFAKLESGSTEVEFETVDLLALISRTIALMHVLAREKGLDLRVVSALKNVEVLSDERMLNQILVNLLGNAIKFTQNGFVEVRVEQSDSWITIEVEDSGVGISSSALGRIFEPFEQESGGTGRRYEGTGLGLPIARRYAELLNGHLDVRSELGVGSTFTLRILKNRE